MTHYKDMYYQLLPVHEATVKQYDALQQKYDDVMKLTKQYSYHMEYCLRELENENLLLKERIKALESTASK
jgi:hypothetical protein